MQVRRWVEQSGDGERREEVRGHLVHGWKMAIMGPGELGSGLGLWLECTSALSTLCFVLKRLTNVPHQ